MTNGCRWRLRWLLGVEADAARMRGALHGAGAGDARRLRGMLAELREARLRVRDGATLAADLRAVSELTGVAGAEARALALRLRGRSWAAALADLSTQAVATVRRAWTRLWTALFPQGRADTPTPDGKMAGGSRYPSTPPPSASASASPLQRWIGRARDGERTIRLLDVFRRAGLLPQDIRAEMIFRHARALAAPCYVLLQVGAGVEGLWRALRRCGLGLLGPAPVGV